MRLIDVSPTDSPEFIAAVGSIVALALEAEPSALRIVRIDHWFGSKWAGFAGKVAGAAGVRFLNDLAVPPFVPARVVEETCYRASTENREYISIPCEEPLHPHQSSEQNLRRRVRSIAPDTVLVWFSGNSLANGRGSVLAYVPSPAGHVAWYADLAAPSWTPKEVIGMPGVQHGVSE